MVQDVVSRPTTSCSTKRSTTRPAPARPTWRRCRRAIGAVWARPESAGPGRVLCLQRGRAETPGTLRNVGVLISAGELSNLLIKHGRTFMLRKPPCMQPGCAVARGSTDDTARGWMASISSATSSAIRSTQPFSPRRAKIGCVLDVLRNLAARTFRFNAEAFDLLHVLGLAQHRAPRAGLPARAGLAKPSCWPCWRRRRRWGRSNASISWRPPPWPPITPNWSSR